MQDELVRLFVDRAVEPRMPFQRLDDGLDDERQERELDTESFGLGLQLLTQLLQSGCVALFDEREVSCSGLCLVHPLGDLAAHADDRLPLLE